ncbi:hypothetical protein V6N12_061719 [Hibiscus sabdariffa]|uniref:RNase H type-1 domain-containing protein n=1 Tax=Hibiscus sabdariffa TaxID=183260 RepID=A0ABR2DXW7_9ROSI
MKGVLKFNTDGAVCGSFGTVEIGGCLRNDSSKLFLYFSMYEGYLDASSVECLEVKEALCLFNSSHWKGLFELVIEVIVSWWSSGFKIPPILLKFLSPISLLV